LKNLKLFHCVACLIALGSAVAGASSFHRALPKPLTNHPGNIFLAGEQVVVSVASEMGGWRLVDYDGKEISAPTIKEGKTVLGQLPAGFYRLINGAGSNWISIGVIGKLEAPTPLDSPVAVDVAMSWLYPAAQMDAAANLCALAGVNWVRDRLNWAEMEPEFGQLAADGETRYDAAVRAQSGAGLRVLQVMHDAPYWANSNARRFPDDLRDAYSFYEGIALRWKGQLQAFEPWNEADISIFGGHTGSEMAALQKAAWLGLKAGNPEIIACLNPFASHKTAQLEDLNANTAWPYFDTFNLHHYEPFDAYAQIYADFRVVSAGKPLWVTECSLPVKWAGDQKLQEPADSDLKLQSERVAKTFAGALHEGASMVFYFLLPHYVEGQTQFGVLRPDLTPRPAFVALAAAGRLLAEARPLGRLKSDDPAVRAYLFRVKPDGRTRELLVAWAANSEASVNLPVAPEKAFDHLGRPRELGKNLKLTTAPVFAILSSGSAKKIPLVPPPAPAARLKGAVSPVVLQALGPEKNIVLTNSAYRVSSEQGASIAVFAYNFSRRTVRGKLLVKAPDGWAVQLPDKVQLEPEERQELSLELRCPKSSAHPVETIRIQGDFGSAGKPDVSFRMTPQTAH